MEKEEKLVYMMDRCCMNGDDLLDLLHWVETESIDYCYQILHYMFDEDDHIQT